MREDRYHVALFDGRNFAAWKYRVLVLLEEYELDDCILHEVGELPELIPKTEDSTTVSADKEKRRKEQLKRRRKCKRLLIERIHDSQLEYVQDKQSPKEIWTTLKNVFERKSVASRMHLQRQILSMRFDGGRLTDHFLRFDKLVREFRGTGAVMDDIDAVCHLLLTLGSAFATVVTSIETMAEENLSMEFVKCRLLDEETKQKGLGVDSLTAGNEAAAFSGMKMQKKIRCFSCKKEGHKSVDCTEKKKKKQQYYQNNTVRKQTLLARVSGTVFVLWA